MSLPINKKSVQSQKYKAMKVGAKEYLGMGNNFIECFKLLTIYLQEFGTSQELNQFTIFQNRFADIRYKTVIGTTDDSIINTNRNKLNAALLEFIDGLEPPFQEVDTSDVQSLRINSEWDSRGNLITYLQLSDDIELIKGIFKSLRTDKKWIGLIRREERFIKENGEIGSLVPEGLELDEDEEIEVNDCVSDYAIWFERKNEEGVVIAGLLVEFYFEVGQIEISANGLSLTKCEILNDLISWFDKKLNRKNLQKYTIGVPYAKEFKVEIIGEPSEIQPSIRLSMNQSLID